MRKTLAMGFAMALAMQLILTGVAGAQPAGSFTAHLTGGEEVPPVETPALGQAVVSYSPKGVSALLVVARIENVVASHIHCAPEGANGPVGVTLFAGSPTSSSGVLRKGPILAPNAGNGCGWVDLDDLLDAVASGDTYVNVHTLANPSGEIRGQLR
jgi:hypothetical protein